MASDDEDSRTSVAPSLWQYSSMGLELAGAVIGLTLLGYWADRHFGTAPRWLLVGAGLGLVGGFYNFIREALQLSRQQQAADRQRRSAGAASARQSRNRDGQDG